MTRQSTPVMEFGERHGQMEFFIHLPESPGTRKVGSLDRELAPRQGWERGSNSCSVFEEFAEVLG